jgi:hypothetical protein
LRFTRALGWGILLTATGLVAACGLFETRNPEQPPPPVQECRPLNGSTGALALNIQDFYGKLEGLTCYSSMLDTTFIFHPDPQDSSQALPNTPFIAWSDSVEAAVNADIASLRAPVVVRLTDQGGAIISPDQNTETHFYDYLVFVSSARYTGSADLKFHRGADGQWRIVDWADHRGSVSDSTWGYLRSTHRT